MGGQIPHQQVGILGVLMSFGYYGVFQYIRRSETYSIPVRKGDKISFRTVYQWIRVFKLVLKM